MKKYTIEREGQIDFFNQFNINYQNDPILIDNTDGVYNGNLIEFKLNITDTNKVLFQTIKYLSNMRVKGESIPANILCVDLNSTLCYIYHSQDYFDEIHEIYYGSASKNVEGFIAKNIVDKINYSTMEGASRLKQYLKEKNYMKIKLDENCIVGWANRYYREYPNADKGDFLDDREGLIINKTSEIREPKVFKEYILPYTGKTNEKFKYLMDKLNDKNNKQKLGAFYTPIEYCKKAAEMVRGAIRRVPEGNDYIILDRCAGTGNLESVLSDEELSHCVVSTYEYYEYKVLLERIGEKVRDIIPPVEAQVEYVDGCIYNADALSKEYIENPILEKYIKNPKCTIILFENPPYSDDSGSTPQTGKSRAMSKNTYVAEKFNEEVKSDIPGLVQSKDLSNLFIWSGFKYYLRYPTDSYILFSPIKYWKIGHFVNKKFIQGYLFNREHFHASKSAISCIYWSNEDKINNVQELNLEAINIVNGELKQENIITVKKVYKPVNKFLFDKRSFETDTKDGVWCGRDGYESGKLPSTSTDNIYNKNILGYIHLVGFAFDMKNKAFVRSTLNLRKNGFYLRDDKYLFGLPLFCAKCYPQDAWYLTDVYSTTADGGEKFKHDLEFLKSCLIYSCLTSANHCISFEGTDNRFYRNELCFDGGTIASNDLKKMDLNDDDKIIIDLWNKILEQASNTDNYNNKFKYGIYQISKELNTTYVDEKGDTIYNYPQLNGNLNTMKNKLREYYKKHIEPKMFEYELLK